MGNGGSLALLEPPMRSKISLFSRSSESVRTSVFLVFLFFLTLSDKFIDTAFKFVAYEISGSEQLVSLVPSISSLAFVSIGLFAGILVDAYSRRFFVYLHFVLFAVASIVFYVLYKSEYIGLVILFGFILLNEMSSSFNKAASNTIFFDLCGENKLARWISFRSMAFNAGSVAASILLWYYIAETSNLFLVYSVVLIVGISVFSSIGYQNPYGAHHFENTTQVRVFVIYKFKAFIKDVKANKSLLFVFGFSFVKTYFVFWPMFVGALLKFGVEESHTRQLFLVSLVVMEVITIFASYFIGFKKSFSIVSFVTGSLISGIGIFLFAYSDHVYTHVATLGIMYVGLALSGISAGYVMRRELPEVHRTQGLSFSVVPYYCADILSGFTFAGFMFYFSVNQLLTFAGAGLILTCLAALPGAISLRSKVPLPGS